jgi:hypothetical protein
MAPPTFSLNDGGPFHALMVRLRLVRPSGMIRVGWLSAVAWLPFIVGELLRTMWGMPQDPTWFDISVHTRVLVALPLMLFAERLVEPAAASTIHSLYEGEFCDPNKLAEIVERGHRMRDARWPEGLIAALAIGVGQASLWRVVGSTGVFHGGELAGGLSFPRLWYLGFALPLVQFVMLRWLWRWLIWSVMLVRISRLQFDAVATHPDRAAGLSCLSRPMTGFGAFAAATGSIIAGAWGTQLIAHRANVRGLMPFLLAHLLIVLIVAAAAQLAFCGHLFRARRRTAAQYGDFTENYVRSFHAKWIEGRETGEQALGTPDIQSLADINNAFSAIERTRWFTFGPRKLFEIWFPALLPMVPLFASALTVEQALAKILGTVFTGLLL